MGLEVTYRELISMTRMTDLIAAYNSEDRNTWPNVERTLYQPLHSYAPSSEGPRILVYRPAAKSNRTSLLLITVNNAATEAMMLVAYVPPVNRWIMDILLPASENVIEALHREVRPIVL